MLYALPLLHWPTLRSYVTINCLLLCMYLQCLCVLAHEIETKEQLALMAVQSVFFALEVSASTNG